MATPTMTSFLELRNRYVLECRLLQLAGIHVGTGVSGTDTDSPFIRQGKTAFIPGSSLRGVMRTTVERMARSLGGGPRCCVLFEDAEDVHCWAGNEARKREFERANAKQRTKLLGSEEFHLCPVCRLFGSTLRAAEMKVSDAHFAGREPSMVRRDGVGIDRDTETARPKIKYDFEVAEPGEDCGLKFSIQLENAGTIEMGLLYVLWEEMERGFSIGSKKARGLGAVKLKVEKVNYFDSSLEGERRYTLRQFMEGEYGDFPVCK